MLGEALGRHLENSGLGCPIVWEVQGEKSFDFFGRHWNQWSSLEDTHVILPPLCQASLLAFGWTSEGSLFLYSLEPAGIRWSPGGSWI